MSGAAVAPWNAIRQNPNDQWLTPKWILDALEVFDLDPCASEIRTFDTAAESYTYDGLTRPWEGRVWLNPPYSEAGKWVAQLARHGHGTALVFARTETQWFHQWVWPKASAVLFVKGRLKFIRGDGRDCAGHNATSASVLIAYGEDDSTLLAASGIEGHYVNLEEAA